MNSISTWPSSTIAWLDAQGKAAWIALMVVAFIVSWPIGLLILAFLIWSNRMGKCSKFIKYRNKHGFRSSGNSAFDSYKAQTLRRLEDEQRDFEEFLKRLRDSKDKAEFDQFMDDRSRQSRNVDSDIRDM